MKRQVDNVMLARAHKHAIEIREPGTKKESYRSLRANVLLPQASANCVPRFETRRDCRANISSNIVASSIAVTLLNWKEHGGAVLGGTQI